MEIKPLRENGWEFTYEYTYKGEVKGFSWKDPITGKLYPTWQAIRVQAKRLDIQAGQPPCKPVVNKKGER